jgi:hypothetical protein
MGILGMPLFTTRAACGLFLVMEREKGAGQLQTDLGEPQEHIGGVSLTTAAAMFVTAFWR